MPKSQLIQIFNCNRNNNININKVHTEYILLDRYEQTVNNSCRCKWLSVLLQAKAQRKQQQDWRFLKGLLSAHRHRHHYHHRVSSFCSCYSTAIIAVAAWSLCRCCCSKGGKFCSLRWFEKNNKHHVGNINYSGIGGFNNSVRIHNKNKKKNNNNSAKRRAVNIFTFSLNPNEIEFFLIQ